MGFGICGFANTVDTLSKQIKYATVNQSVTKMATSTTTKTIGELMLAKMTQCNELAEWLIEATLLSS